MRVLQPAEWSKPRGFSHGVEIDGPGRWIVLAGQTGGDDKGEYVPDMAVKHFHGRRTRQEIHSLSAGYFIGNGALYAKHMQDMLFVRHLWSHLRMATNEIFGGRALDAALGLTYRRLLCFTLIGMAIYWFSKFRKI